MQITKADVTAALALLRHEGCTVQVSPAPAGRRVVLRYGQELWQTDGASTAEALSALLGRMLPSAMTKALFASALRAKSARVTAARATDRPAGPDVQVRRPASVV